MKGRTVTAKDDIAAGQTVVVDTRNNSAKPARNGTRKLKPGDMSILAVARAAIRAGEQGLVDDAEES